jgi:hypothetical protein
MSDGDKGMHPKYYGYMHKSGAGSVGFAYFLAFIGAAVYYIQQASSFGDGILGVLKALVWPAFLIYHLLGL